MRLLIILTMPFVLASAVASCSHARRDVADHVYQGTCRLGFEQSDFTPEGSPGERWWLSGNVGGLASRIAVLGTPALVTLKGHLSERGHFGHMLGYERDLRLTRVLEVQLME